VLLQEITIEIGPLGLILAMIIQSIISPIPSEIILSLAGSAYISAWGLVDGFVIAFFAAFIGSLLGGLINYYIGLYFESLLKKRISLDELKAFEQVLQEHGILAIIIARLIPFLPFDAISYVAGFVKIKRRDFIIGTMIGLVPRISFYLLLGAGVVNLVEQDLFLGLIIFLLIVIISFALLSILKRHFIKKIKVTEQQSKLKTSIKILE